MKVPNSAKSTTDLYPHNNLFLYIIFLFLVTKLNGYDPKIHVVVSKLEEQIAVADHVVLSYQNDQGSKLDMEELLERLTKQNLNKIYQVNNKLLVKYYGRQVVFTIEEITSVSNKQSGNKECFYVFTPETKLIASHLNSKTESKRCLLNTLGGLNDVIEELIDTISFIMGDKNVLPGKSNIIASPQNFLVQMSPLEAVLNQISSFASCKLNVKISYS